MLIVSPPAVSVRARVRIEVYLIFIVYNKY